MGPVSLEIAEAREECGEYHYGTHKVRCDEVGLNTVCDEDRLDYDDDHTDYLGNGL